ncbi:sensor histidine kinase [Mycobacterium sp. WMMD1722]|uniref:sensor histidine kinase n=1 Tax=Mycobacterium sp. WMMD1722 TaxID=3404117 RepID=UPI003BF594E3
MSTTSADRSHRLRSVKIAAVLRIGVIVFLAYAAFIGTRSVEWGWQAVLLGGYALAAGWAVTVAVRAPRSPAAVGRSPFLLPTLDVAAIFGIQLISTGAYIPLLMTAMAPLMVALEVSSRRAAALLAFSVAAFAAVIVEDQTIRPQLGWDEALFLVAIYAFLCCTTYLLVHVQVLQVADIAALSASREALLVDIMTASDAQRRQISETLHDGPLQEVLAARQQIRQLAKRSPSEEAGYADASLRTAAEQLRETTFELHPAVLEQAGLGVAVERLASFTAARAGIEITASVDHPQAGPSDAIVFAAARELLANVTRHAQATRASVTLTDDGHVTQLDVADDGVGIDAQAPARRLAEGHIGLASQRARIEAAGGTFIVVPEPVGTHVRIRLPRRG